ncbi:MAG: hypothetical protein A7315_03000 [Candidatus Altiarchaeales archaeon WOR_SM1_79]|nr:MAG: hypothetical protein A7315_03000 [Candidatus Altiarchaeales archaeon WOR_SM1_79]
MKILYISPINIATQGGQSNHFREIGENLQKLGNELLTICRGKGERFQHLNIKGIPNVEVSYLTPVIADFFLSFYLLYYVLSFRPDVVYYRGVTLGGIISRVLKIPSVAEANGIYPDEVKVERPRFFELAGNFLKLREKINYYLATRIICITEGIKSELAKNYDIKSEICTVIPNGVNTNLSKPMDKAACRKKLGLEEGYFCLGFVGSFRAWQGLDTLIEAMKVVKDKGFHSIRCVLVGDGESMNYLKDIVNRYGLHREIVFVGRIRYEEVSEFINAFDVCLAPFKRERNEKIGLSPLKLYEYLACARAVIASRVQGVSEVIERGKCGYLFEPGDATDLALRIFESYGEWDRLPKLGHNGRILVEKNFSWEKIARSVENVLRQAVRGNHMN